MENELTIPGLGQNDLGSLGGDGGPPSLGGDIPTQESFTPPSPAVEESPLASQYEVLDGSTVSNEFGSFTGTPVPEDLKKKPEVDLSEFEEFAITPDEEEAPQDVAGVIEGFEEFAAEPTDEEAPEPVEPVEPEEEPIKPGLFANMEERQRESNKARKRATEEGFFNPVSDNFLDFKLWAKDGKVEGIERAQQKVDELTKEFGIDEGVAGSLKLAEQGGAKLREFGEKIQDLGEQEIEDGVGSGAAKAGQFLLRLGGGIIAETGKIPEKVAGGAREGTLTAKEAATEAGKLAIETVGGKAIETVGMAGKAGVKGAKALMKPSRKALAKSAQEVATQADDLVGAILQGDKASIAKGKRALSSIDTTNVKSFDDMATKFTDKKKGLAAVRDELLDQDQTKHLIKDLGKSKTVAETGEVLTKNPVDDALGALEKMNEGDIDELARIKSLRARGAAEGLTRREINDISVDYGRQVGKKAFDARGNLKETMKGIDTEAIRSGVKDAARGFADTDELKAIDSQFSDIINTEKQITKMSEAVNKLRQKAAVQTGAQKLAGKAGELVDFLSGGTIKTFTSKFLPSNVGLKTMNSLQIQEQMAKNLTKLNKIETLMAKGTDEAAEEALKMLRKEKLKSTAKGAAGLATTAAGTKAILD